LTGGCAIFGLDAAQGHVQLIYDASAPPAQFPRYSSAVATIQIRDLPEHVAQTYRRRAEAAGQSLQAYMREQLIEGARRRDKAEVIAVLEQVLASSSSPGISQDTIEASRQELRDA
jgi:antitoxin FitA